MPFFPINFPHNLLGKWNSYTTRSSWPDVVVVVGGGVPFVVILVFDVDFDVITGLLLDNGVCCCCCWWWDFWVGFGVCEDGDDDDDVIFFVVEDGSKVIVEVAADDDDEDDVDVVDDDLIRLVEDEVRSGTVWSLMEVEWLSDWIGTVWCWLELDLGGSIKLISDIVVASLSLRLIEWRLYSLTSSYSISSSSTASMIFSVSL